MNMMHRTAAQVFRICATGRNLRRVPCHTAWTCHSHTAALPYSSNSNTNSDNNKSILVPSWSGRDDGIRQALATATTLADVLLIVKQNRKLLDSSHWLATFQVLHNSYSTKLIRLSSIHESPELLQICELLKRDIKSVQPQDAVFILKVLSRFGVPSTSLIVQSLLQLIRTSLSQLSLRYLLDLSLNLSFLESTPLVDALNIAIPIMCEIQLTNNMIDTDNTWHLISVFKMLYKNSNSKDSINMIVNALIEKKHDMTPIQAARTLRYLCDSRYLPVEYKELLANLQQILIQVMPQLLFKDIEMIMRKIMKQVVLKGNRNFYNEEFLDTCAKTVISNDFGFDQGVTILRLLYLLSHTHLRLIDYLAAKWFENPSMLNDCSHQFVICLAQADYKPIFWESMQEMISKNTHYADTKFESTFIQFVISMAVFDCYDEDLTKFVFTDVYLKHLYSSRIIHNPDWYLLLFYQSIKTLYPTYTGPWPDQNKLKQAMETNKPLDTATSLLPILENAVGGSPYVLSNLKSKLGHRIDHVVVMRKGGYPVAVNLATKVGDEGSRLYIEDLQLPAESQVIIILNIPARAYAVNSQRLKGDWGLLIRTIEKHTGHAVIPINSITWNALMDREKTPYLLQAIRLKCDSVLEFANVR